MDHKIERKKASDFPQELLNLLDGYVHGGVSRRQFLDRAQKFAVGGVTAMALFEMLRPNYAWAIQIQPDDKRIKTSTESVPSPQGYGTVKGYLARPANDTKLPVVLGIHGNRGLNPRSEEHTSQPPSPTRRSSDLRACHRRRATAPSRAIWRGRPTTRNCRWCWGSTGTAASTRDRKSTRLNPLPLHDALPI